MNRRQPFGRQPFITTVCGMCNLLKLRGVLLYRDRVVGRKIEHSTYFKK